MLVPSTAHKVQPLYAFGDTPANSLTRMLPQGVDAAILSLGCGDVRNVLYTAYFEQGFPPRKLDITCCDHVADIHVRNILFYSFLVDGLDTDQQLDRLWDVYYHLRVDDETLDFFAAQVKKLSQASSSFEAWRASVYGQHLRFCDHATFRDFRTGLVKYSKAIAEKATPAYAQSFRDHLEKLDTFRKERFGKDVQILPGFRSVAPVVEAMDDLPASFAHYWEHGITTVPIQFGDSPRCWIPNPAFAASVTDSLYLHYGADPTRGYHLATAYVNLTAESPFKIGADVPGVSKLVKAARAEFRVMAKAFQAMRDNIFLRFATADALAFCYTLQNCSSSERSALTANWYRRQFDMQRLELDPVEYGTAGGKLGPVVFDVVDTSNLADRMGMINLLAAGTPLLSDTPYSALFTELLDRQEEDEQKAFDSLLCGHTPTVAILLGITPAEYYTNARATSGSDDFVSVAHFGYPVSDIRSRLSWKLAHHFSGRSWSHRKLKIAPVQLAATIMSIYKEMFCYEEREITSFANEGDIMKRREKKCIYPPYHRGSLAAVMRIIKDQVVTDWADVCRTVIHHIYLDSTIPTGAINNQDLAAHMHMWGVHTESRLLSEIRRDGAFDGGVCAWRSPPDIVAITFVIPRGQLDSLFGPGMPELDLPTLVVGIKSRNDYSTGKFHYKFADVQLTFGKVASQGSRGSPSFEVQVKDDPKGWQGTRPLIACFYVPAAIVQTATSRDLITLELLPDPHMLQIYGPILGDPLEAVHTTTLGDKSSVYITKFLPGHSGYTAICPPAPHFTDDSTAGAELTLDVNLPTGRLSSITGSVRENLPKKKNIQIRLRQAQSPFVIIVLFGDNAKRYPVRVSVPVDNKTARLRMVREPSRIEVVAEPAEPARTPSLQELIYPAKIDETGVPVTLSVPHINLDILPIVDVSKKEDLDWLRTVALMTFSTREGQLILTTQSPTHALGPDTRLNVKERLASIIMVTSGLRGDQTNLFALKRQKTDKIELLIAVSAVRLDVAGGSVVADAAVIWLTEEIAEKMGLQSALTRSSGPEFPGPEFCELDMGNELDAWKKMVPSMVERCRTWNHEVGCEYARGIDRGLIPLSLNPGDAVICSCGFGKFPSQYLSWPRWEEVRPFATRAAIGLLYCAPSVEEAIVIGKLLDPDKVPELAAVGAAEHAQAEEEEAAEPYYADWGSVSAAARRKPRSASY